MKKIVKEISVIFVRLLFLYGTYSFTVLASKTWVHLNFWNFLTAFLLLAMATILGLVVVLTIRPNSNLDRLYVQIFGYILLSIGLISMEKAIQLTGELFVLFSLSATITFLAGTLLVIRPYIEKIM